LNIKIVLAVFASILMVTMLFPTIVTAPLGTHPNITLVSVSIGEPETVDPGWCYDTASAEIIMNVYDTLVWFNTTSMVEFVPSLATDWYFNETGMYWNFTIRQTFTNITGTFPVTFHNGALLTPSDVEYSFERWMVLDHGGGPTWMIFEPLLGCDYWDTEDPGFAAKVDASVESDANNVYFYYQAGAFPPMIFLQTIAQSWASILDEDWAKAQGCWDGNWSNTGEGSEYYDPTVSPIDKAGSKMCGTGPYKLAYWTHGIEWSAIKNNAYWGPWPADASTGQACDDYVDRYVARKVDEWSTRKLEFVVGAADYCYVPRMYMEQLMKTTDPETYLPGLECTPHLATLQADGIFFNYNISNGQFKYPVSPYLSGLDYGELDKSGICPDFFSDEHVRKACAYSIDYETYIEASFMGEAVYPSTPSIFGLDYRRPEAWYDANAYEFNLTKAEEEWKLAWGGALWTTGFTLTITYNTGNIPRKTMADMLEANIEGMNGEGATEFNIETMAIDWGSTYIPQLFTRQLPLFIIGWLADYPDPHNFYQPFMAEYGAFSGKATQGYYNPEVEALLNEEIGTTNETRRQEIFYRLQEIYIEDCPSVCVDQPEGRHWNRDWVKGWYYNQIYPGTYIYHTWIEEPSEWGIVDISVQESISDVAGWLTTDHGEATVKTCASDLHIYPYAISADVSAKRLDAPGGDHPATVYVYIGFQGNDRGFNVTTPPIQMFGQNDTWTQTFYWNEEELPPDVYNMTGRCAPAGASDDNSTNNWVYDGLVQVLGACDGNGDNVVSLDDLLYLIEAFWSTPSAANWDWSYDVDCDNDVDLDDLLWLIEFFWTEY
jgi:peptide/nickel transport system substrate-binding protein